MAIMSKVKSTLNSWSNPNTIKKSIATSSAKGAVVGGTTGTIVTKAAGGKKTTVTIGTTGGTVLGANIGAINGAVTGSVKYGIGSAAKYLGWTK